MAEVVGTVASIITIVGLLKSSVEAFDLIQAGRRQESDLRKLKLRLDVEKYRLSVWGEAMGLMKPESDIETAPISSCPFQHVIKDILQMIVSLFTDTQKIEKRYGCRRTLVSKSDENPFLVSDERRPIDHLAVCFRQVENGSQSSRRTNFLEKARWSIYDKDKFNGLILEVKGFIDGLQDITHHLSTRARQDEAMRAGIKRISDMSTLMLISEVCQADYPDISDVASMEIEAYSMSTEHKEQIEFWADNVVAEDTNISDLDIENLSITELKHQLRQLQTETSLGRKGKIGKPSPTVPKKPDRLRSKSSSVNGDRGADLKHHTAQLEIEIEQGNMPTKLVPLPPKKPNALSVQLDRNGKPWCFPDGANLRLWTARSGEFHVDAQFLGYKNGRVHLHKKNGVKIAVPSWKIARDDLDYVEDVTGIKVQFEERHFHEADRHLLAMRNIAEAIARYDPRIALRLPFLRRGRARSAYEAVEKGELNVRPGDEVDHFEQDRSKKMWMVSRCRDGSAGFVPSELIDDGDVVERESGRAEPMTQGNEGELWKDSVTLGSARSDISHTNNS